METTEDIKGAIGRTKQAIARRAKQAEIAEQEKQRRTADEALIAKMRNRLTIVSQEHRAARDQIGTIIRDVSVARRQVTEWNASIERQEQQLAQLQKNIVPLENELKELQELLSGVK